MSDRRAYWAAYYQRHRERIRERLRVYRKVKREQILARKRVYWGENRLALKISRELGVSVPEARRMVG